MRQERWWWSRMTGRESVINTHRKTDGKTETTVRAGVRSPVAGWARQVGLAELLRPLWRVQLGRGCRDAGGQVMPSKHEPCGTPESFSCRVQRWQRSRAVLIRRDVMAARHSSRLFFSFFFFVLSLYASLTVVPFPFVVSGQSLLCRRSGSQYFHFYNFIFLYVVVAHLRLSLMSVTCPPIIFTYCRPISIFILHASLLPASLLPACLLACRRAIFTLTMYTTTTHPVLRHQMCHSPFVMSQTVTNANLVS